jgi:hypothetical protein
MKLNFEELVDEIRERESAEIAELAVLIRQIAHERWEQEILDEGRQAEEQASRGELKFSSDPDELLSFLDAK